MTISAPANYNTELAKSNRTPIYAVEVTDGTTTHEVVTSPPLNGGDFATAPQMLVPLTLDRKADPRNSRFQVATFTFIWLDIDGVATTAVTSGIDGFTCTFYGLFFGLDWTTDKTTFFKGVIADIDLIDGGYRITARSAISLASKRLFDSAATTLFEDIDSSQTTCLAVDAGGFQSAGDFLIGTERITYTGTFNNGDGTWSLSGLTRGAHSSTAAAHSAGDKVQEVFIIEAAHPFDILNDVLTGAGQKTGLELDSSWVDSTNLAAQKTAVGSTFKFSFEIVTGQRAKDWIEKELLLPMACYPVENNDGQIGVALFDTPDPGDFSETVTDSHVVKRPVWRGAFERRINSVVYTHDWNVETRLFEGGFRLRDASLIAQAGREYSHAIESQGVDTSQADTETLLAERAQSFIERFGVAVPIIEAEGLLSKELLELGDPVFCTFDNVVSLPDADRSINAAPFEVIAMRIDYKSNIIRFELLGFAGIDVVLLSPFVPGTLHSTTDVTVTIA